MDDSLASSCTGLEFVNMDCTVQTLGHDFELGSLCHFQYHLKYIIMEETYRNEIHDCGGKEIQI